MREAKKKKRGAKVPPRARAEEGAGARALAPELPADTGPKIEGGRGKYVYCIIQSGETLRFGPLGIGSDPADVHTRNYKGIAAVGSDTPIEVHEPTRENVL